MHFMVYIYGINMTQKKKTPVDPSNREAVCYLEMGTEFLITFAKLRKVTAGFILSVHPSVLTDTSRLPVEGFFFQEISFL